MASDYKKIAEDHEKRYGWDTKPRRIYKRLYSDKTHFVYELIQNADETLFCVTSHALSAGLWRGRKKRRCYR